MNIRKTSEISSDVDSLIITSTTVRHKFFALKILKSIPNSFVIFEPRDRIDYYKVKIDDIMSDHFEGLFKEEEFFFQEEVKKNENFLESKTLGYVDKDEINSTLFLDIISRLNPKCIALYSVSILRDEIISKFSKRLFNVHAGLSPYYRGTATNIWPIINNELEFIGMTIHHIDKGIDSGGLIIQDRPVISEFDNTHTMACKNTILSADLMIKALNRLLETGSVPDVKQDLSLGRQYFFKDFDVNTVKKLYKLLGQGIVKQYLSSPKEVDIVVW